MDEDKVDLTLYMDNRLHVRMADWLYRTVFQPLVNLVEKMEIYFTRKWCEKQIPPNERL